MNLLGGLGFAVAIALMAQMHGTLQLMDVVGIGALLPLMCLSLAGLTEIRATPVFNMASGRYGGSYAVKCIAA